MTSKLCPHVQVLDAKTLETIQRVQPPMVKMMDLNRQALQDVRRAAAYTLIVARQFVDRQVFDDPVRDAQRFALMYAPVLDLVNVVEVYNEAVNNTTPGDALQRFDAFQCYFAEQIWELNPNVKIGLFCLPTGNFGYPGEPALTDFSMTRELPIDRVYICLHEYAWHTWDWESPARCLRYRRQMQGMEEYQLLITECGLTQAVIAGRPDIGWRSGVSREVFIDGACWYDSELKRDPYVVGAAMFTCGTSYGWDTFECTAEWEEAARRTVPVGPIPPPPPMQSPIRVRRTDGTIETLELEAYLPGVVGREMYPVNWPSLGPTEPAALEAQAIAARSYALWRVANPRAESFDIYDDTRDQAYDSAYGELPKPLAAVRATTGVYVVDDDDRARMTQYVSRCGRMDCGYCIGKDGYNDRTWTSRMCQWGAQWMAGRGYVARAILRHYYGDIRFSDDTVIPDGGGDVSTKTLYKDPATDSFLMSGDLVVGCRVDISKAEDRGTLQKGQVVYRVVRVMFLNEEQARGDTRIMVTVLDRAGRPAMAKVINAWPQQRMPNWDGTAYDWATPTRPAQFAQGGGNYNPSKHGPLGPYVILIEQDAQKQAVVSDWCIGFGLPGNRHVAYEVTYQECLAYEDDLDIYMPGDGGGATPGEPTGEGCTGILTLLIRLLEALKRA